MTSCQWSRERGRSSSSERRARPRRARSARGRSGSRRPAGPPRCRAARRAPRRPPSRRARGTRGRAPRRARSRPPRPRQRALREGGEPAQRFDLVAEQLDPHRPLLGRRVDVEDPAAHGELAALGDLLLALVAARDQALERLVEVELLPTAIVKPCGRRSGSGTRSISATALATTTGARSPRRLEQRVERRDPQAHQVGRGREVRLVANAARRVEAHRRRARKARRSSARSRAMPVVGGDDQRRGARRTGRAAARRSGTGAGTTTRRPLRARPPSRASRQLVVLDRSVFSRGQESARVAVYRIGFARFQGPEGEGRQARSASRGWSGSGGCLRPNLSGRLFGLDPEGNLSCLLRRAPVRGARRCPRSRRAAQPAQAKDAWLTAMACL